MLFSFPTSPAPSQGMATSTPVAWVETLAACLGSWGASALTVPLGADFFLLNAVGFSWRRNHTHHSCCLAGHTPACQHVLFLAPQHEAAPGWAMGVLGHLGSLCSCREALLRWFLHPYATCVLWHLTTVVLRCWRRPSKSLRVTLTSHWSSWKWKMEPQQRYGKVLKNLPCA